MVFYALTGAQSLSDYITTGFYTSMAIVSLVILSRIKSDEPYYEPLTAKNLGYALLLAFGMFFVSWGLSLQLKSDTLLLDIAPMSLTATPTSVSTSFLSTILFGLAIIAVSEELWKLPMFAEGKARWGKGYDVPKPFFAFVFYLLSLLIIGFFLNAFDSLTVFNFIVAAVISLIIFTLSFSVGIHKSVVSIPGALVYVGVPVGFWAALHGIQAYESPLLIIPAFINGVFLIVYLWKFKCILGAVFAHFGYNSIITVFTYLTGNANINSSLPILPNIFSGSYYSNSGFLVDGFIVAMLLMGLFLFLVPSVTGGKEAKHR
jgi:hypothetical protein